MNSIASVAASDPAATRLVYALVAALVLLGLAMVALTVWLVRSTRPERELLAPLELMSHRKWRRSDPVWQRRQLDAVRPPGAEPLAAAPPVPTPDIDLRSIERDAPRDFDDLASELLAGLPAADSSAVLVTDLADTTPDVGDQNEGGSVLVTDLADTTPDVGDQNEGGSVLVTDSADATPDVGDQNEGGSVLVTDSAETPPEAGDQNGSGSIVAEATPEASDQTEGASVLVTDLAEATPEAGDQNGGGSVLVTDLGATTAEVGDQNEGGDDPDSTPTRMVDPLLDLFRNRSAE